MWKSEQEAKAKLEAEGWEVIRNGWPDFLCLRGDEVRAVEIKVQGDKPSKAQLRMHEVLRKLGIPVVVDPPPPPAHNGHWVRHRPKARLDYDKIVELSRTRTYEQVAAEVGCSRSAVRLVLKKRGLLPPAGRRKIVYRDSATS